jgi:hypothetical protein
VRASLSVSASNSLVSISNVLIVLHGRRGGRGDVAVLEANVLAEARRGGEMRRVLLEILA